jgi:hypothetical protein
MTPELLQLHWEERREGGAFEALTRDRKPVGCSTPATIIGGLCVLFLAYAGPGAIGMGTGGIFPMLLVAVPAAVLGLLALGGDRGDLRFQVIRLDAARFTHGLAGDEPWMTLATSEIGAFAPARHGGLEVLNREGVRLHYVSTPAPAWVAARLSAALAEVREPRTYRG